MILNLDKFQAILVKKSRKMKDFYALNISNQTINFESCIKLLEIEIDNTLSFDKNISNLCKKASNELNMIGRIQKYMSFNEKSTLKQFIPI